jgi:RNA polymerase primary sigma factor
MKSQYDDLSWAARISGMNDAEEPAAERDEADFLVQTAPLLSAEAEHELAVRIKAGDRAAREELTLANMRLVINIARGFKVRGMELDDLIQEGCLGLMRATEDFDPETHGTRFSTYAACWIRHYILRAVDGSGSMIHFPYYLVILRKRFERVKAEMMSQRHAAPGGNPSEPSMEAVAERMGIDSRRLRYLRHAQVDWSSYSNSNSAIDDQNAGSWDDQLSEDRPPEKPLEIAEEMERLHAAINQLPRFEAWLLKRRFRLDDHGDDVRTKTSIRPSARSRAATHHDKELEARRIKRINDQNDGPRPYRELERECGLGIHRLKQIESKALEKLQIALAASSPAIYSFPATQPRIHVERRASA